jgi:anaerobic selenocysteine-containing dehydrogenase
MSSAPSDEELIAMITRGGRVDLEVVKLHPDGATFPEPEVFVQEKEPGWSSQLDVGNMEILSLLSENGSKIDVPADQFPFRLICQRVQHMYNSTVNVATLNRGRGYNPAFFHPDDLELIGAEAGDVVEIVSRRSSILAVANTDAGLRRGCIAMTHGFGDGSGGNERFLEVGSPVGRLLDGGDIVDELVWMPRMSNVPVNARRIDMSVGTSGSSR